jgi:gluconolactonase
MTTRLGRTKLMRTLGSLAIVASGQDVFQVLIPGEAWQLVSDGHRNTDGPAVNAKGEMFFTDPANNRIYRADSTARPPCSRRTRTVQTA